jgi:hypothetical protein
MGVFVLLFHFKGSSLRLSLIFVVAVKWAEPGISKIKTIHCEWFRVYGEDKN